MTNFPATQIDRKAAEMKKLVAKDLQDLTEIEQGESEALCGVYEAGCLRCAAAALLRQHFGLPVEQAVIS